MPRQTINTICSKTVTKLRKVNKKTLTYEDIRDALNLSKPSVDRYVHEPGYLVLRGYLKRVIGGWELTEGSKSQKVITVIVTPNNANMVEEVETAIDDAISKYGKVVNSQLSMIP